GELREPPLDLWPQPVQEATIFLRPERVARLLGVGIERAEIERLLTSVGFFVAPKDGRLAVQVPGWRPDVTREVDLIEEVARLKGYDAFPDELRAYGPGTVPDAPDERARAHVREQLMRAGLLEARTLPLGPPDGPDAVPILNPMSAEEAYLRRRLLPGLVRRIEYNWANRNRDIRLFEVGTVFRKGTGAPGAPEEWTSVAGVLTGARRPPHWSEGAKLPDMDIWDLKYHFELAVGVAAPGCNLEPATGGAVGWEAVQRGGGVVGWAGPLEADAPVWAAPLFGFEVRLDTGERDLVAYRPLPLQPPVERDLALVLPPDVTAAQVSDVLRRTVGPLLERLEVFDEYRGPGIPAGHRGVAWHCSFRDPERTLRGGAGEWGAGRVRRQARRRDAEPGGGPGAGEQDAAPTGRGGAGAGPRSPLAPDVSRRAGAGSRRQRRSALGGRRRGGGWGWGWGWGGKRSGCRRRGPVSTKKHAVKVMIGGEEYTVRSDLPPEYTREVAAYVDQALKKVLSQGPIVETHKAAILAALDITNELFQAKKGEREVAARLAALADDLAKLLPPGKRKAVVGQL